MHRPHSPHLLATAPLLLALALPAHAQDAGLDEATSAVDGSADAPELAPPPFVIAPDAPAAPVTGAETRWALRLNAFSPSGMYGLEGAVQLGSFELAINAGTRFGLAAGWRHDSGLLIRVGVSAPAPLPDSHWAMPPFSGSTRAATDLFYASTIGWEWRIDHLSLAAGTGIGLTMVPTDGGPSGAEPSIQPTADLRAGWLF